MDERLKREAAARRELHKNRTFGSIPQSEDCEELGLRAEAEFARSYGLEVDMERRPGGDGGKDFVVSMRAQDGTVRAQHIDAKGMHPWGRHLLVEEGRVHADVFVLVVCDDERGDGIVGWAWRSEVLAHPAKLWPKLMNHAIHLRELHRPFELRERIMVI